MTQYNTLNAKLPNSQINKLLTNTQVSIHRKAFANGLSANIKLSKLSCIK